MGGDWPEPSPPRPESIGRALAARESRALEWSAGAAALAIAWIALPVAAGLLLGTLMHLADLRSYLEADERLCELYTDPLAWTRKTVLNVAGSGKFSSDRTIADYAKDIWNAAPCPVEG